jgi:drug/metabolite transporter (DMT)-like permease
MGGSAFMLLVVLPVLRSDNATPNADLLMGLRNRWKRFVHPGILVFLVTGFYNYFRAMPNHKGDGLYHALVGTKIILAFAVFFLASALVGRSATFEGMRKDSSKWLSILCLLGLVIVAISGFVKVKSGIAQ